MRPCARRPCIAAADPIQQHGERKLEDLRDFRGRRLPYRRFRHDADHGKDRVIAFSGFVDRQAAGRADHIRREADFLECLAQSGRTDIAVGLGRASARKTHMRRVFAEVRRARGQQDRRLAPRDDWDQHRREFPLPIVVREDLLRGRPVGAGRMPCPSTPRTIASRSVWGQPAFAWSPPVSGALASDPMSSPARSNLHVADSRVIEPNLHRQTGEPRSCMKNSQPGWRPFIASCGHNDAPHCDAMSPPLCRKPPTNVPLGPSIAAPTRDSNACLRLPPAERIRRIDFRRQPALRIRRCARHGRRDHAGARGAVQPVRNDLRAAVGARPCAGSHLHARL